MENLICVVILVSCGKTVVGLARSVWSRVRVYCRSPLGKRGGSHGETTSIFRNSHNQNSTGDCMETGHMIKW